MSKLSAKWFLAAYALLLGCLALLRPMWLDELLQLSDAYRHTMPDTAMRLAHDPGGVPLAYLGENLVVNTLGHPFYTAHLFSIFCAIAGMASLIWLVGLLGNPGLAPLAASIYALLPISLRYAVEARQYGPALAFSICATALLVWLDRQPSWPRAVPYGLTLALGLYTQPYIAFIAIAQMLWALRRPAAKYVLAGCAGAALLFLPWYLYAHTSWVQAVKTGGYQSSLAWNTPLMVLHELSGGGYFFSIALLALAARGYRGSHRLLWYCALVPVPLALIVNAWFHYFFAIRQLLFIVPPLCLLAAQGLWSLPKPGRTALTVTLALAALVYDFHWFTHSGNVGNARVFPVLQNDTISLGGIHIRIR